MPFGFLNLIYIAVLWSRWSNKVIHLNAYMVYVLINIALLSVSLARVLEADYVNCPSPAGAIGLFVVQLLVCVRERARAAKGATRLAHARAHTAAPPLACTPRLCQLLALGIAAYLRLHVLHTSALAGARTGGCPHPRGGQQREMRSRARAESVHRRCRAHDPMAPQALSG